MVSFIWMTTEEPGVGRAGPVILVQDGGTFQMGNGRPEDVTQPPGLTPALQIPSMGHIVAYLQR